MILLINYKTLKKLLEIEIREKYEIVESLDEKIDIKDIDEINVKLNFIIQNQRKEIPIIDNSSSDNSFIIFLFILIATGITLYFIEQKTYYIQRDNLNKIVNEMLYGAGF